jgi:hypothetical protein
MRKHFLFAGILLVAALVFANSSKADTVEFVVNSTALGGSLTFTLPETFTPTAGNGMGSFIVANVDTVLGPGSVLGTNPYTFPNIELSLSATQNWSFGNNGVPGFGGTSGNFLGIAAPGLFTINPDGTITLNVGNGTLILTSNAGSTATLTTTVIPGPVATPEPAALTLLGLGGVALAGLRRRKAA